MAEKYVYGFGGGRADGTAAMKEELGGKGANLAEMTNLGLPVPPGFTLSTAACRYFFKHGESWPEGLWEEVLSALARVEELTGKKFGDRDYPLLVSVRSGAPVSMPGMMDTVLNLGLNDQTVEGLAARSDNPRFAWDAYRRFIAMFGDIVLDIHYTKFSRVVDAFRGEREESELSADDLKELVRRLKQTIAEAGHAFPDDPFDQLRLAINAVFKSFNSHRARFYRKSHGLSDEMGTAVNVQAMVFGNMGVNSATGVCFTRDPNTGSKVFWGDWLPNAQGEDVVAGTHTPLPLNAHSRREGRTLAEAMPEVYEQLVRVKDRLERHFRDMQDIEFTIENGRLYLLQTRTGKRSPAAAVQVAVDMVHEGLIDRETALCRVRPKDLELVLRPVLDPEAPRKVLAKGQEGSPGAASGRVVFSADDAQAMAERGEEVLLVRVETSPEDIQGMTAAQGILTTRGGQTSHAAVVARGMGKPCVVACNEITVDYARELFYAGDTVVRKGDWITIDGATGEVMEGKVPTLPPATEAGAMAELLGWADERARLNVRANADNASDAARARKLGATGIGLCRTEHMFFKPEALKAMQQMLLAADSRARARALAQVLPLQRKAFHEIFVAMDGLPVTIRLLDPPLHEFLPKDPARIAQVAQELGVRTEVLQERLGQLHETNPMMGHRGCRIGVTTPEIYKTQTRAIFEAACAAAREGATVLPEVMIPLVSIETELEVTRAHVVEVAEQVMAEQGISLDYKVGTMIELPRAALTARNIARHADFFSFGTNDLTQMTFGFSRDDMGSFLHHYLREGILRTNPLSTFDTEGVGQLVKLATERGRHANARLRVGVCGEHGGDPTGVAFFHRVGLDYVSCSPFRVPVARLAAAQAALGVL